MFNGKICIEPVVWLNQRTELLRDDEHKMISYRSLLFELYDWLYLHRSFFRLFIVKNMLTRALKDFLYPLILLAQSRPFSFYLSVLVSLLHTLYSYSLQFLMFSHLLSECRVHNDFTDTSRTNRLNESIKLKRMNFNLNNPVYAIAQSIGLRWFLQKRNHHCVYI